MARMLASGMRVNGETNRTLERRQGMLFVSLSSGDTRSCDSRMLSTKFRDYAITLVQFILVHAQSPV